MSITLQSQIACARLEVKHRMKKFPRLVEAGKMTAQQAQNEIRAMQAIVSTLESLRERGTANG